MTRPVPVARIEAAIKAHRCVVCGKPVDTGYGNCSRRCGNVMVWGTPRAPWESAQLEMFGETR